MQADPLNGKRVGIIGFARQGRSLARWLPSVGAVVTVADSKTADQLKLSDGDYPGVHFMLGGNVTGFLDGLDVLCLSGGVPLDLPLVEEAVRRGIPLANDAQLFLERCPAPVIGITGSAGKTTTTTLCGEIMKLSDYRTWVGGNIGDVLLDVLPQIEPRDCVVMELSSFQLEIMTVSPFTATVLNVTPNHLDRHGTMENYIRAKSHIIAYQNADDIAVLGRDDAGSRMLEQAVSGELAWFSMREMVANGAFMAGQRLVVAGISTPDYAPHILCERDDIHLRGDHNVYNVLAACAITGAFGADLAPMQQAVMNFRGVPHRLEVVREVGGVTYVNDSIATAPERVLAALRSYDEPLILLAGGRDKKLDWEDMIRLALHKTRQIIAFGEAGDLVMKVAESLYADPAHLTRVNTLEEAVAAAASVAQAGDVVLLSPGGTSYDAYQDFAARGEHFRQIVGGL
jgi:UDP-N-acetylmuramoylalanine--D-glutamate ligase